jgi:Domain of unknown function (DUF222)
VLFKEIRVRTARPDDNNEADRFGQRWLRLDRYYRANGQLAGDLTAPAATALQTVLDSLGTKAGPEDTRTIQQRNHDALEEACRRLLASGCLPEREGQPVQLQVHMTLSQLLGQADPALAAWITASGAPAPPGADCDATVVPIVAGRIDETAAAELAAHYPGAAPDIDRLPDSDINGSSHRTNLGDETAGRASRAARQLAIADAVALLSGPGGLAAQLRGHLAGPAGAVSLPLDIGAGTETIPAHIRRAVTRRDQHCRLPGCDRPPIACHVHHLRPRADGGETSVGNCCLLCTFHHLIAVHRWGWTLVLNPDGTTVATSPDRSRVLHSHAPPTAA